MIIVNIFVLDTDPMKAAEYHNDKHVVKMILESAQMLSTVHNIMGHSDDGRPVVPSMLYKPTHIMHPCNVWARETGGNYLWLSELALALCLEYTKRYGRRHKSQDIIEWCVDHVPASLKPTGDRMTPYALAMPDEYKRGNAVLSYRLYYMGEKRHIAAWKTHKPRWWK